MISRFFLFLDIDGVLYDMDYVIKEQQSGRRKKGGIINYFKPESIEALNKLTENLSKKYDFTLVISSTWRIFFQKAIKTLTDNGVVITYNIDRTPISITPMARGKEILAYLKKVNFRQECDKFLIIDDEMFDYKKYFSSKKIIKTDIKNNALSWNAVENYLSINEMQK